jgi:hypothetical protein
MGDSMAVGIYFEDSKFTPEQYSEALAQLEAAGAGSPAGRVYHVALESDGQIRVFDIWDSQESFEAFGAVLIPILEGLGADGGQPVFSPVHNEIKA